MRFIAGARCPKCHELDSIRLVQEQGMARIECVSCGYSEVQTEPEVAQATRGNEQLIGVFKP